ncbi:MAG: respiratory nitrate reductase subunit gamma [Candidatus Eremiobacteraeota bacterium]|nr:respiratory nitrate reductase subunit gamma [Candidatus Eremiobacteraeota bacterium]MBV8354474.1 respiratory nitrate reductase subunit gamma [Candidatus Eremiobacteraeota bacterium]
MSNVFLFEVWPYIAFTIFVVVGFYRYFNDRFSFSSQSSQFLENRLSFWGSTMWHYGIILILIPHTLAFWFPKAWGVLISDQTRLYILEVIGLGLAVMAIVGLGILIVRRIVNVRANSVTSIMDWVLLAALALQVVMGFWVAYVYRWGSEWYLHTSVPWLQSLATFNPQIQYVTALPIPVKIHMLNAFMLLALFPFTRLVHVVTLPLVYLARPYQVVIWYRQRKEPYAAPPGVPVIGPDVPYLPPGVRIS